MKQLLISAVLAVVLSGSIGLTGCASGHPNGVPKPHWNTYQQRIANHELTPLEAETAYDLKYKLYIKEQNETWQAWRR